MVDDLKPEPRQELSVKQIPVEKSTTAKAAIQFAGKGIIYIRDIPEVVNHPVSGKRGIPLSEAELIGRISIGNLLFAQGLELIFKLIFMCEGIEDKRYGPHALVQRFDKIRSLNPIKQNIQKFMPNFHTDKMAKAAEVVKNAEEAFMIFRYLGLKPGNLKSIYAMDAAGLLLSLTLSYQGLEQDEAARLIGIDIKNLDGSPFNEPFSPVREN